MNILTLQQIDERLFLRACTAQHWPGIILTSRYLSKSGDGYYYPLLGVLAYMLSAERGADFFIAMLSVFLVERPLYWLLKNGFKRDRPAQALLGVAAVVKPSDQFSLPSGHTSAAFVVATTLSHFFPDISWFAYLWACLVGTSRVMLRVHFPADVICGAGLGCALASLILFSF